MVELARLARGLPGRVVAKLEMRNPCGSVKDRVGVALTVAAGDVVKTYGQLTVNDIRGRSRYARRLNRGIWLGIGLRTGRAIRHGRPAPVRARTGGETSVAAHVECARAHAILADQQ